MARNAPHYQLPDHAWLAFKAGALGRLALQVLAYMRGHAEHGPAGWQYGLGNDAIVEALDRHPARITSAMRELIAADLVTDLQRGAGRYSIRVLRGAV